MHTRRLALVAASLTVLAALTLPRPALAETQTFCGVRTGTAGNAYLEDRRGRVILELARQGGGQRLLQVADELLGRGPDGTEGTQVGRTYCMTVRMSRQGWPTQLVDARRVIARAR